MSDFADQEDDTADWDAAEVNRPVICPTCGVSALPPEHPGESSICENAGCDGFGEAVR